MTTKVLIAYASPLGSTRGIAERIGARLAEQGISVDVRDVADVRDMSDYGAVVLGSAVHHGKWVSTAREFARRNRTALADRPTWLFSVSSVGDRESFFGRRAGTMLRKVRRDPGEIACMRESLHAREHRNFAGVIRRGDWGLVGDVFLKGLGGRHGDHRNWPAIDTWGEAIARELQVVDPVAAGGSRNRRVLADDE